MYELYRSRSRTSIIGRAPQTKSPPKTNGICGALLAVTRPNQVWAMDITYIPMARGFVYLAVVLN